MKIHTKVVIDIASGAVVEDQWHDYDGPVALAGGGGDAPAPSPEERALQSEQADTLRMQRSMLERQLATQDLLSPFLYEELGLRPTFGGLSSEQQSQLDALSTKRDRLQREITQLETAEGGTAGQRPSFGQFNDMAAQYDDMAADLAATNREIDQLNFGEGAITGFEEIPPTEAERLRDQIELGLLERSQRALEGKLPVSPTLEREISEQGETLSARLRRNLGPGFETSSPAIEALQEHESRAIEAREAARRGELTLSEQLSLARGGQNFQMGQASRGELSALPAMHPNFSNVIAGFNAPLNRMADERWRQFQIESQQPSFGSTLGQIFGIGVGAATGGIGTAIGTAIGQRMI